jgi:gliding motility-associated-like protein
MKRADGGIIQFSLICFNKSSKQLAKLGFLVVLLALFSATSAFSQLNATFSNQKDACDGLNNGSIEITVTGSVGSIQVDFLGPPNAGPFSPTDGTPFSVTNLPPRTYLVIVQDDVDTKAFAIEIFDIVTPLTATINTTADNTDCTSPNGAITLTVSGGTGAYSYLWTSTNGFKATTKDISGLLGDSYTVEVFDDGTNCSRVLLDIPITNPIVIVQTITTPSPLAVCPSTDAIVTLGGSEAGKTYEILVNGVASGFTSPGDALGGAININLPSGNYADGDVLTVEGFEGVCPRFMMSGSVAISISNISVAPSSATVDNPNYCDDAAPANIILTSVGGSLGTGGVERWYDDALFTNLLGAGPNLSLSAPLATTTYYVRFEGTCNTTTGQSVTVTVDNASVAPTSATVDNPTYCNDAAPANITLTAVGGSLGTGTTEEWYDDAAFTSSVGSGSPLILTAPLVSTTYFVRYEGICGNTSGQSVAVVVDIASIAPTSAIVDNPNYCDDAAPANIILTSVGGSLGTGGIERWYDDALFTNLVGVGPNLSLPSALVNTTYYVRFEGSCNTTTGQSVTITVDNASVAPTSATVDNPTYCNDAAPASITLTAVGGSLGTGATEQWYDDAAFTSSVGSGTPLILTAPLVSTTYFVRYEGSCGNTSGQSVAVVVDIASVAPTSATVDNPNYCDDAAPANIVLSSVGGSLGTGSVERWYDDALFTNLVGVGPNLSFSAPLATTTYYVRFEGTCNTTAGQSVTVTVDIASVAPTSASVDNSAYCDDNLPVGGINLSFTGGSMGTGATAEWFADAAFTNNVGSGNNLNINPAPSTTTTYYVRYEGTCGNTTAQNVAVTVSSASLAPTGATVDNPSYCDNAVPANIILTSVGGSLGTGSVERWYDDALFTNLVGVGPNLSFSAPLATTTYYVRFEGSCNTTAGQSVTVTVDNASVAPASASVDAPSFCDDAPPAGIVLTAVGGSLGTGAAENWYDDAAFTNLIGVGPGLTLPAPLATTTYFVRFEGTCNTTAAQNVTVTVDNASVAPTSAAVDNAAYCDDAMPANIVLSFSGGSQGTSATAEWYDDAALTNNVGSGNNLSLSAPNTTSTYYVRFEGACNITAEQNVTVTVDNASVAPTSAVVDFAIYCADATPVNIILSYTGGSLGTGATAEWYDDAAFTNNIGSGNNLSLTAPTTSTTYFVRFEGTCGNTSGQSVLIDVIAPPSAAITGALAACFNSTETYLVAAGEAAYSWTLTGGDGVITSGAGTPVITIDWGTAGGDLSVTVTGALPTSCISTSVETIGVFSTLPALTDQTTATCQNSTFPTLVASPLSGAIVSWYNGPSATGTLLATGDTFTPTAGELDLTTPGVTIFTYTQDIGCVVSPDASFEVSVEVLPDAGTNNSVTTCGTDASIDLFTLLGGTPDTDGNWSDDDSSGGLTNGIFDPTISGTGIFNFTYRVDGQGTCGGQSVSSIITVSVSGGVSGEIGVIVNTYPEQDIGAVEVINITSDDLPIEISLEDDAMNVIFDWTALEADRLGEYSFTFTLLTQGNYVVMLRDAAGCDLVLPQTIGLESNVFIPNVITPNGDGYNEIFKVLNKTPNTQIVISNRWGVKVFESSDYQNDWFGEGLPDGVYFYSIKMAGVVYQGNVEIWRNEAPGSN